MCPTRSAAALLVASIAVLAVMPTASAGEQAIDECELLSERQARRIIGTEIYDGATPDNDGCSWGTDPLDRTNIAFVTLTVEPAAKLLARYDDDLRTYLDESTNVGIDELPGVGDEAFSTYSPLSGPGTSDGISVLVGKNVVRLGFQPAKTIENPSRRFDRVVRIVKKVVAEVRAGS